MSVAGLKIKNSALSVQAALACLMVSSERETCNAAETISKRTDQLINRKLIGEVIKVDFKQNKDKISLTLASQIWEFTPFIRLLWQ